MIQTDNVVCVRQAMCDAYITEHNATFSSWAGCYMLQPSYDTCKSSLCYRLACVETVGSTAQSSLGTAVAYPSSW